MKRHADRTQNRRRDLDATREKLIEAAGEVFAEQGYAAATVRDICTLAGANVAAINYHFGDKRGLYAEVLKRMTRTALIEKGHVALERNASPEEILRGFIRVRVRGLRGKGRPNWHFRIIARELAQPTPVMSRLINKAMRPVYNRLLELVGNIIGLSPDDEKTRLCTHSVVSQIHFYSSGSLVLKQLWPELKMTPEQLDRIADHVADFSLGYLRTFRSSRKVSEGSRGLAARRSNQKLLHIR